jgi:phosphate:Na+ symporter
MTLLLTVADLGGFVALLLWGVHMVQTGVQRAFGARLRGFLTSALRNRVTAALAGLGVTAVLQSSTATGLMVTGFATSGLVDLVPALAVMLGANVGTTLIVQVLSFNVTTVAPPLILVGVTLFRKASAGRRDFGRVLIGLGLILLALHGFVALLEPYDRAPDLRQILRAISAQPVVDVAAAAVLTWAAHSSVAIVLLVMSFAARGMVSPEAAFALVLGANLGTAINPVLEGTTDRDPASRRLPVGNLLNRIVGVGLGLMLLPVIVPRFVAIEPNNARLVADFHTAFNLVLALIFLPLLAPYAALLRRWLPTRIDQSDPALPKYLEPTARESPVIALGVAARETLRLVDVLAAMLRGLRDVLEKGDRRQIAEIKRMDDVIDRLNAAIKAYLTSLDPESLNDADHQRIGEILAFATNLEQAGDIVDRGLLALVSKKAKRGLAVSREGEAELRAMIDRLLANIQTAAAVFMSGDERTARLLVAEKEAFRALESEAKAAHFARLRSGRVETAETSAMHLDALQDLKTINSHLVAVAYPVLERKGALASGTLPEESTTAG